MTDTELIEIMAEAHWNSWHSLPWKLVMSDNQKAKELYYKAMRDAVEAMRNALAAQLNETQKAVDARMGTGPRCPCGKLLDADEIKHGIHEGNTCFGHAT